ncbi:Imm8 family immunity protein [Candidatus Dependentiae bacterium]
MGKLILHSICFVINPSKTHPKDLEDFDEELYVNIGEENEKWTETFFLRIISIKRLDKLFEDVDSYKIGIHLKNTLIMKYYDETIIKDYLKNVIRRCNLEKGEKAFNCLTHHLEYECEEELY